MENNKQRTGDIGEIFMDKITAVVVPAINDVETSLGKVNEAQAKLAGQMNDIKLEVASFKDKLQNIEIKATPPNTAVFEALVGGWFQKVIKTLEAFPKKHSFRILFFPEHNTLEYLKKLWRLVFKWLFLIVLIKCFYTLGNKWLDNHAESNYKKAWETLYNNQGKQNKKIMDKLLTQQ